MKLYRISKCDFIHDLSGNGAFLYGGRWNSEGKTMLYTSSSIALCMLEALVHSTNNLLPISLCLLTLSLDEKLISKIPTQQLPQDWNHYPYQEKTKKLGDNFLGEQKYIGLQVPSAVIELEFNILLNPSHLDFNKNVKVVGYEKIAFDKRLIS